MLDEDSCYVHWVLAPVAIQDLFNLSWIVDALVEIVLTSNLAVVFNEEQFALSGLRQRPEPLDDVEVAEGQKQEVGEKHQTLVRSSNQAVAPLDTKCCILELEALLVLAERVELEQLFLGDEVDYS